MIVNEPKEADGELRSGNMFDRECVEDFHKKVTKAHDKFMLVWNDRFISLYVIPSLWGPERLELI